MNDFKSCNPKGVWCKYDMFGCTTRFWSQNQLYYLKELNWWNIITIAQVNRFCSGHILLQKLWFSN